MALYLGNSEKLKINVDNITCCLIIPTLSLVFNGVMLLSSDNFILKDSNGIYLIAKEDE